ncbi:unnamed protein product [Rotaria socialis]|uniref:Uncharacterized protein n=1 Tax=Rotaria socialis TaxID=392032 RepID=A0A820U7E4_9BILA|nr:unnamed protein product [Rotaria socialis]
MTIHGFPFVFLLLPITIVYAFHFRGGTIARRPWNNSQTTGNVQLLVRQRYSWRRASFYCDDTTIDSGNLIANGANVFCASGAWLAALVVGGGGNWAVVCRINAIVRPDGYINSSLLATTLPAIYKAINQQHVHVIQMSDNDRTDTWKCRWATSSDNTNSYDECAGVCSGVPGAVLYTNNCTLVFTLPLNVYYTAVTVQIEDYYSSSSAMPMSFVPLVFLFYGYTTPSGCSAPPSIVGVRPNRSCVGTPIGSTATEYVIAQVGCNRKTIINFTFSSPIGMTKGTIQNPSTGVYQIVLSWIPVADQYGSQGFCAGAVDSTNVQSEQWCITFLAATKSVGRPTRNGTYIHFTDPTSNTLVQSYGCGWAPEFTYAEITVVIRFSIAPWTIGHSYYVAFDSGVASGAEFCGILSSTTTTTTTSLTTGTVTTRGLSTSTANTLLTTTDVIIITGASTQTTTTSTSAPTTTITSTTMISIVTVSTIESPMNIMCPQDFAKACQQSFIIMQVINMCAMAPRQVLGMLVMFTKFSDMFNPLNIQVKLRHVQRIRKLHRY